LAAGDVIIDLDTSDGSSQLAIENSSGVIISSFSSRGDAYFKGKVGIGAKSTNTNLTINGNMALSSGSLYFPDNTYLSSTDDLGSKNSLSSDDALTHNVVYVDNSGNVGIGITESITSKLYVNGKTFFNNDLTLDNGLYFSADEARPRGSEESDTLFISNSAGAEGLRVTNSGNIGIGSGGTTAVLHISSDTATSSQYYLKITTGTTPILTVRGDERVGIGTDAPSQLFCVGGNNGFQIDTAGNMKSINGVTYTWPAIQGGADTLLKVNTDGDLSWESLAINITGGGTENYITKFTGAASVGNSVIYESGGNIGIGTTVPGNYKLNVNGPMYVNSDISYSSYTVVRMLDAKTALGFIVTSSTGTRRLTVYDQGNVGIGSTTAPRKLSVYSEDAGNSEGIRVSEGYDCAGNAGETKEISFYDYWGDSYTVTMKGGIVVHVYNGSTSQHVPSGWSG
ncbi:MAG: hypothetical protein ABH857_01030, partial [Elusimicrobiota bacterium]